MAVAKTGGRMAAAGIVAGARIGHYELIRELGRGGMGVVYLARDTKLARRVAIKFLVAESRELIDAFLREARSTAACNHENIVVIHEADERDGVPYMVLEYLEGQSLRGFVKGRRLSQTRAVELMVPVARALSRAHELGIVHRDLKPENIFVTTSGTIKVLDFGIAALFADAHASVPSPPPLPVDAINATVIEEAASLGDEDEMTGNTLSGSYTGTLPYMAPEQFETNGVDRRSDLWAVGIMLYEMLVGHHPIQPLDSDTLWRNAMQLDKPMPRVTDEVPDISHRLAKLVDRCLTKRRDSRISTAREVLVELESLLPSRVQREIGDNESPYPGLVAFQEGESDRFFGRGRDVLQVLARLREHPLGAIIGPSGVGKSSFVRAGVIPSLKASGERWEAFILRPGRQPLQSLATMLQPLNSSANSISEKMAEHEALVAKLRDEPGYLGALFRQRAGQRKEKIVLFVDQFEELYTVVSDEMQRRAFIACLSGVADDAAAPLRVLLSLRSDFLDRVGEDKRFADDLARGLVLLQPLGREALREALRAPVEQLGHTFESPEMIEEMVTALASTPGALPLLQFAGGKLWDARDRQLKVLTAQSYRDMGGISGVLAQHADQVVNALSLPMQRLTRSVFQRLVTADGTRAIVDVTDLTDLARDPAEVRTLVDQLVQARLLVVQSRGTDEAATIELVHESLITGWPLLRRWLDEGRDDAAFRESLRMAARQWQGRGKPQGLLWRGEAMEEARLWRARHADVLPPKEQEYLDAVFALANRAQRLRRTIAIGTIAFLSLVIALGAVALLQVRMAERRAVDEAAVASREAERARAAEAQVKAQLEMVRSAQEARNQAQSEVVRGKADLRVVNAQLQDALVKAEAESKRAREAADGSHRMAESLQKANGRLEKLLADERARAERLERERRKITTELR
jgi:serine/threonine protein kinase